MPTMTIAQLVEATGGRLLRGDPATTVDSYVINTRVLQPGGVFFALQGQRTDGHRFLGEAAKRGGAAAVISRELADDEAAPPALILVDDAVAALSGCGRWIRQQLSGARWFAITGSNGKTTTKELLAEGLSASWTVHRTLGNFNNHLGVPLTLLACPDQVDALVLELAMSGPGEIAELTRMTDPDLGLITNVRAVHLQYFQSLDDIAAAKGELFALLRDDAISVVNLDDPHVRVQSMRHVGPRFTYGRHAESDLRLESVTDRFVPGAAFTFRYREQTHSAQLMLGGSHAAYDALAALACVAAVDLPLEPAIRRMERLEAGPGRGRVMQLDRGIVLVDDSYNSSPAALASVMETLHASPGGGRKVLVMGDMLELGNVEGALHREAGKRAAAAGVELLVTVGTLSRQGAETARRAGVAEVHHYADAGACSESIHEFLRDGDLIVVKGSRSIRLEHVVEALARRFQVVA